MAKKLFDIKKVVSAYVNELESRGVHVEEAILFGSYASGAERADSDIDLVVLSRDLGRFSFPERLGFLSRATLNVSAPLEVIGYTPDEVKGKKGESIFWDEICSKGRVIYKAA